MVKCEECGRVINLVNAATLATEEQGDFRGRYFCSQEHMDAFAKKSELALKYAEED